MTQSMTSFGAAKLTLGTITYNCEIRTVNHRYLDVNFRLPDELRAFEAQFRQTISDRVAKLWQLSEQLEAISDRIEPITASDILKWPGVLRKQEADLEQLETASKVLLEQAVEQVQQARQAEGSKLQALVTQRIDLMNGILQSIKEKLPEIKEEYRQRIEEKLASVIADMDETRIEQEMVLFLNKSDVMEEVDRLEVHFAEVKKILNTDKPQGRRLDFLMQELNREVNTLGSKSQNVFLTQQSVELKVLIEQMREQVQNIE